MTRKIYANKLVKGTLNAYMRAVAVYDTLEVHIGKTFRTTYYNYAMWQNGEIVVRWKDMSNEVLGTTPLKEFPIDEQNFITTSLLNSMHDDMVYRTSEEYVKRD